MWILRVRPVYCIDAINSLDRCNIWSHFNCSSYLLMLLLIELFPYSRVIVMLSVEALLAKAPVDSTGFGTE